jgi:hypothetical protein
MNLIFTEFLKHDWRAVPLVAVPVEGSLPPLYASIFPQFPTISAGLA